MKRIGTLTAALVVTAGIACQPASASTARAPGIDYVPVRDAASEELVTVDTVVGDVDEMLAPRGFDLDYLVSRDAASELDLTGGDTNALLVSDWIDDNALDTPRIVSFVGDDGGDIDEMFAARGFDFDYLISRDAAGWDE